MKVNLDCIYYVGEKPCRFKRLCEGCDHYRPMGTRILMIKLAAIGDVVRTTSLLAGLKRTYKDPHVTWVTDQPAASLLASNPDIQRLFVFDLGVVLALMAQRFDVLICLDKEPRAVGLAGLVPAEKKLGFALSTEGSLTIFNPESAYALRLGLDDPLKFYENKKSYPEIIYEMCAIPYRGDKYTVTVHPKDRDYARRLFAGKGLSDRFPLVGLNTGSGPAFTRKAWTPEGFASLARALREKVGATVVLMGGEREKERNSKIETLSGDAALALGDSQSLPEFAAMLSLCDLIVTGDTLALHLAVGLSIPTVAIFGPTAHREVDLFGLGEKVVTAIECAPCYRGVCDKSPGCMDVIGIDEVLAAAVGVLQKHLKVKK
jgi:heptosyltransferase-2